MAPVPLNISPAFRPWRQAGIHTCSSTTRSGASSGARRNPSRPKPRLPSGSTARRHSAGNAASLSRLPIPLPHSRSPFPAPRKTWRIADRTLWPRMPGRLLADAAQKTPPALAGLVLSVPQPGSGRRRRRRAPRLPAPVARGYGAPKSHAFWPLNRYPYGDGESEQTVDARMFLSGIAALKPESVILMCGQVPSELGLAELRPLSPSIVHGHRYVVTPHVDDLIGKPQRYAQLITFLKSIIAGR
ncbi:MAG: hypothetical protein ACLR7Z_07065 [Bilophila wadsworthia]